MHSYSDVKQTSEGIAVSTLSIHNLDPDTEARIRELARREGRSLNQVLQQLLRRAVGSEPEPARSARDRFGDVFGQLPAAAADDLLLRLEDERRVDPADWR